ncbi:hypothetical protein D3C76_1343230 [compost metagenome]
MMTFELRFTLIAACLILEPLAEKIVSPLKPSIVSLLTPVCFNTGCVSASLCLAKGEVCAALGISFHPRFRSFMISTTLTPEFFFNANARSVALYTFLYVAVFDSLMIPPPAFPWEKPVRL